MSYPQYRVSFVQEAQLWAHEVARELHAWREPPAALYPIAIRINGALSQCAARLAVRAVVSRHSALRTTYARAVACPDRLSHYSLQTFARTGVFVPGVYAQRVHTIDATEIVWRHSAGPDAGHVEPGVVEPNPASAAVDSSVSDHPIVPAGLHTVSDNQHLLWVAVSHLGVDGWSAETLRRDLCDAYRSYAGGNEWLHERERSQSCDFAIAEWAAFRAGRLNESAAYWRNALTTRTIALLRYMEVPRLLRAHSSQRGIRILTRRVDNAHASALKQAAAECRVTLHVLLRAAMTLILHVWTGKREVAVWGSCANRLAFANRWMVANCATPQLVFSRVDGGTVREFCQHVAAEVRRTQRHETVAAAALPLFGDGRIEFGDTRVAFDAWPSDAGVEQDGVHPYHPILPRPWVDLNIRCQDNIDNLVWIAMFRADRYDSRGVGVLLDFAIQLCARVCRNVDIRVNDAVRDLELDNGECMVRATSGPTSTGEDVAATVKAGRAW